MRQPHQPLLRPVVDVALEPAHRLGLRDPGGVAAALDPGHLVLQLGAAAQQHPGQAGVDRRHQPDRPRQGQQQDDAEAEVEQALRRTTLAEAEQVREPGLVALGDPVLPEPVGEPGAGGRPTRPA